MYPASMEPKFDAPRLAINRVYTRTGDNGETGLAGGQRVAKDSRRIEAYGSPKGSIEHTALLHAAHETPNQKIPLLALLLKVHHTLIKRLARNAKNRVIRESPRDTSTSR